MSRYIVDVSSVGLPDRISANENRMKEKLENIGQNRRYIGNISVNNRYIGDNISYKIACGVDMFVGVDFFFLIDISVDIGRYC